MKNMWVMENNWEMVYILIIIIREPKTQVWPWQKTITILKIEILIILFIIIIIILWRNLFCLSCRNFWEKFFGKTSVKCFFFQQKQITVYMKSIFYQKKRIVDPYYLVAPRPDPPQGWDGGGTEVGMDGWMDGHDQRRDSNTLNNLWNTLAWQISLDLCSISHDAHPRFWTQL